MPQRDELNVDVPFLGSANEGDTDNQHNKMAAQSLAHQSNNKSGHWLHTILITLLIGCVGAMAYLGYDFLEDQQQRSLMTQATESRIAELEQLLSDFKVQEEKSGQTLKQQLDKQRELVTAQKAIMDSQYQQYETKFAKLIEQTNAEQAQLIAKFNIDIETLELKIKNAQEDAQDELGFMTSQQKAALLSLEERLKELDGLRTSVTNLEISQTKMSAEQKGLLVDVQELMKNNDGSSDKVAASVVELKKEIATLDANFEQYKGSAHKSLNSLTAKVSVIAKKAAPQLSAAVSSRLNKTEAAIRAIDGSRAQVNQEIQRLKTKVNKIQLQLQ